MPKVELATPYRYSSGRIVGVAAASARITDDTAIEFCARRLDHLLARVAQYRDWQDFNCILRQSIGGDESYRGDAGNDEL